MHTVSDFDSVSQQNWDVNPGGQQRGLCSEMLVSAGTRIPAPVMVGIKIDFICYLRMPGQADHTSYTAYVCH